MAIKINQADATKILQESFDACSKQPIVICPIKDTIDFVMDGKQCTTYRYIMMTALLAKAVDSEIDILSLQSGDQSNGAYNARTLASEVVFPFQEKFLGKILGVNEDPLANKPGRFLRLDEKNAVAKGNPQKALKLLCTNLPKIKNKEDALTCLNYVMSLLISKKDMKELNHNLIETLTCRLNVFCVREFMSELLDKAFRGTALVAVAYALYRLHYSSDDYEVVVHPVNQPGTSKQQFSDLDLYKSKEPFVGTELKDKDFRSTDIARAANTACKAGAKSLIFVAGRQSSFASQTQAYFDTVRNQYAKKNMYVGIVPIDTLMDTILSVHTDLDAKEVFGYVYDAAEKIGNPELQMWVFEKMQTMVAAN